MYGNQVDTIFLQWLTHKIHNDLLKKNVTFLFKDFSNPLATQDPRKYIGTQSKDRKYFIYLCFKYF